MTSSHAKCSLCLPPPFADMADINTDKKPEIICSSCHTLCNLDAHMHKVKYDPCMCKSCLRSRIVDYMS